MPTQAIIIREEYLRLAESVTEGLVVGYSGGKGRTIWSDWYNVIADKIQDFVEAHDSTALNAELVKALEHLLAFGAREELVRAARVAIAKAKGQEVTQ